MSKEESERTHALRRLKLRYEVKGNPRVLVDRIEGLIQKNKSTPVKTQSNRISIHLVSCDNQMFKVVYDKARHQVVTFLPLEDSIDDEKEVKVLQQN